MRRPPDGVPVYRPDIYANDAIVDPYPHYSRLRELGDKFVRDRRRR